MKFYQTVVDHCYDVIALTSFEQCLGKQMSSVQGHHKPLRLTSIIYNGEEQGEKRY